MRTGQNSFQLTATLVQPCMASAVHSDNKHASESSAPALPAKHATKHSEATTLQQGSCSKPPLYRFFNSTLENKVVCGLQGLVNRMARSNTALTRLPESVVEYIFSLVSASEGDEELGRDALPFVCRNFNRIYCSSKLLWGSINVDVKPDASDEKVAGLLPSLRHRGSAVARLLVRLRGDKVALPELMAQFSAGRLRQLYLDLGMARDAIELPANQLSSLGRFTRLQRLRVFFGKTPPPLQNDLAWLSMLTGLRSLSLLLNFSDADASACASISRLTALSSLQLHHGFPAGAQLSSMLAGLSGLQKLDMIIASSDQQQLGAACFSHLQQLSGFFILYLEKGSIDALEEEPTLRLQLGGLSSMPRLQQLSLNSYIHLDLQDLLRCSQLRRLSLGCMVPEPFQALEGGRLPCGSLPALTSLEWQPDRRRFEGLGGAEAGVDFPEELCQLTQLQELRAKVTHTIIQVQVRVTLPAAFSQLRELRLLEIASLGLREVPVAITGLSNLECLDLSRNYLSHESFPPGPYLANLRYLNLHGNCLHEIPEALASATKLEALDISENLYYLQFSAEQLGLLPGLRRLYITKRLIYLSPLQPGGFDPATPLWSTGTLEAILQVQRRFPSVAIVTDKYMRGEECRHVAPEEWWEEEWFSGERVTE